MDRLNRQLYFLYFYAAVSTIAIVLLFHRTISERSELGDLIRTRGIIIEDEHGRDRILIGAPLPTSAHRIRTDSAKAYSAWAEKLGGGKYMEHYGSYTHSAVGMLVLNEEGHDRVVFGDELPDPNTGKRIAVPTGMLWNDHHGFELGGIGANRLIESGRYRVGLGLDDEQGEGLHMMITEDGSKFIRFAHKDKMMLIGRLAGNGFFGNSEEFFGARLMDAGGAVVADQELR